MTQKLVVIGAGMASGRVLEHLFEAHADYEVTLFNAEARGNYNRIMLSPVLSGDKSYDDIVTHDADWYETNGVTCHFGTHITAIDSEAKTVTSENGAVSYDKLLIATGSAPFIIPVQGKDLPGVITYRDLDDTNAMIEAAEKGGKAVVIGGEDKVEAVLLDGDETLGADLVVMAVGIRPETRLATDAGLSVARGIEVNAQMQTSDPDILAAGECVELDGQLFGLVAPLYDQAKIVANSLMNTPDVFIPKELSTKLKVTGCDLFSAGDFAESDGREDIVFRDPAHGVYRRLVLEDDTVVGAIMYGDTADSNWFFGLIRDKTDISEMRETLIFGPTYQGGAPSDPLSAVAALPREAEICGCNGVCKGQIEDAIAAGATDLAAIKATTKASASCGTCTGLVEQVLAVTLGDEFVVPAAAAICGCTEMTHEDVRRMIKSQKLRSMPAVWQECGWKTSCGCHICRPALNYYLLADWPLEYTDDPQSRFINERKHANIQKDGTFSVVPRMWGGITMPDELRAIANAADKFAVPTVKVTGGQRIDLLGVKGEDLPAIWDDLNKAGMVSGHAYSKGLRTVKTCVGTDHCRFGNKTTPAWVSSWKRRFGGPGHRTS